MNFKMVDSREQRYIALFMFTLLFLFLFFFSFLFDIVQIPFLD